MGALWNPGDPWTLSGSDPGAAAEQQATALRALATEVEAAIDDAGRAAVSPHWHCPNAEDVRARFREFSRRNDTVAADLRQEASRLDGQATQVRRTVAQNLAAASTSGGAY